MNTLILNALIEQRIILSDWVNIRLQKNGFRKRRRNKKMNVAKAVNYYNSWNCRENFFFMHFVLLPIYSNDAIAWNSNSYKWLKVLLSEKCISTREFVIQGHVFRAPLLDSRIDKSGANGQHEWFIRHLPRHHQKRSWSADDTLRQNSAELKYKRRGMHNRSA